MNLTETNKQINMIPEHSVSSNNWLNINFNAKSFNAFLTL